MKRREFEMTDEDLTAILAACRPVPMIMLQGVMPRSPQENANAAWSALGKKMGFEHMTVQPVSGKDQKVFTAEADVIANEEQNMSKEVKAKIREAARAHSDLNIFASVVTILEGGHIYTPKSFSAVERIIKICRAEQQKRLREYDRAVDAAERAK